jgi:hypothetical protein
MIEYPCLSCIIHHKLGTMAGTIYFRALVEKRGEVVGYGTPSVAVNIRAEQVA